MTLKSKNLMAVQLLLSILKESDLKSPKSIKFSWMFNVLI